MNIRLQVVLLMGVALTSFGCTPAKRSSDATVLPVPAPPLVAGPVNGSVDSVFIDQSGFLTLYLSTSDGAMLPPVVTGADVLFLYMHGEPFNASSYSAIRTRESNARLLRELSGKRVVISFKDVRQRRCVDEVVLADHAKPADRSTVVSGVIDEAAPFGSAFGPGQLWLGITTDAGRMLAPVIPDKNVPLIHRNGQLYNLRAWEHIRGTKVVASMRQDLVGRRVDVRYAGTGVHRTIVAVVLVDK